MEIDFEKDLKTQLIDNGWYLQEGYNEYQKFYIYFKRLYHAQLITPQVWNSGRKKLNDWINERKLPMPNRIQKEE